MRVPSFAPHATALVAALAWSAPVWAQTGGTTGTGGTGGLTGLTGPTLSITQVVRLAPDDLNGDNPLSVDRDTRIYWVSRNECLANQTLRFVFSTSGTSIDTLRVRADAVGQDCSSSSTSNQSTVCPLIYDDMAGTGKSSNSYYADIRAQDIVASQESATYNGPGSGTTELCDSATGQSKLEFTFLGDYNGTTNVVVAVFSQSQADTAYHTDGVGYDVDGPAAPTDVSASAGENRLLLSWTPANDDTIEGYRFYCQEVTSGVSPLMPQSLTGSTSAAASLEGGVSDAAPIGTGGLGATGGRGATGGAGGSLALTGGTGAFGTGATAGTGGTLTSALLDSGVTTIGTATDAGTSACGPTSLIAGQAPSLEFEAQYACGKITGNGANGETNKSLKNDVPYQVAVAAVDNVGNVGPLSTVQCATPLLVDSFFELYKRAGGPGGGGFCTASPGANSGRGLLVTALAILAGMLVVRRRRT
jgi:hypothetical protein